MLIGIPNHMKVQKTRYIIDVCGLIWEVDNFSGLNTGLILEEIKMFHPDQSIEMPSRVIHEVTRDRRYSNFQLARHHYTKFAKEA